MAVNSVFIYYHCSNLRFCTCRCCKIDTSRKKEILNTVPSVVSVEFGEAIEPSSFTSLMVTDEQGNRVDLEKYLY
ncbi:hypothetical protein GCM10020331_054900 [Ectobacillus funiculus]